MRLRCFFLIFTISLMMGMPSWCDERCDTLLRQLDEAIGRIPEYDAQRQKTIDALKVKLHHSVGYEERFECTNKVVEAYRAFNYDSMAYYLNQNLLLAERHSDKIRARGVKLKIASLYASAGFYLEALRLLNTINPDSLSGNQLIDYYRASTTVYGEAGHYTRDSVMHREFRQMAGDYREKLIRLLPEKSLEYYSMMENHARFRGNDLQEALRLNKLQLDMLTPESSEYAAVAYFRSWNYLLLGDKEQEEYWLLKSALSDIQHSTKDQASLWTLASRLAEQGDVERSYLYIRTSQDGLRFYNTSLRNLQSVRILSMIDHNYQLMTNKQNRELRFSLIAISMMALLLLAAVIYVIMQMRRLKEARHGMHEANLSLKDANSQLGELVEKLQKSNMQLADSNKIKEMYIGRFLALCSLYLQKIDNFRNAVLKKAKSGQLSEFLATPKMREMKESDLNDFMHDFDHAFLSIVPTFIEDFNKLLKPEGRISPNKGELLTTELRIFALIRMGISDSSQIADFLHYSVNTIYNYRAKVKNSSLVPREDFENEVRNIGNIS